MIPSNRVTMSSMRLALYAVCGLLAQAHYHVHTQSPEPTLASVGTHARETIEVSADGQIRRTNANDASLLEDQRDMPSIELEKLGVKKRMHSHVEIRQHNHSSEQESLAQHGHEHEQKHHNNQEKAAHQHQHHDTAELHQHHQHKTAHEQHGHATHTDQTQQHHHVKSARPNHDDSYEDDVDVAEQKLALEQKDIMDDEDVPAHGDDENAAGDEDEDEGAADAQSSHRKTNADFAGNPEARILEDPLGLMTWETAESDYFVPLELWLRIVCTILIVALAMFATWWTSKFSKMIAAIVAVAFFLGFVAWILLAFVLTREYVTEMTEEQIRQTLGEEGVNEFKTLAAYHRNLHEKDNIANVVGEADGDEAIGNNDGGSGGGDEPSSSGEENQNSDASFVQLTTSVMNATIETVGPMLQSLLGK